MDTTPEIKDELRTYKNRAWQAEERIKTQKKIICVLFALLLIFLLQAASYGITLRVRGLRETYVLLGGRMAFGSSIGRTRVGRWLGDWVRNNEYRVIFSERRGGGEFATLRRNRLGIWRVDQRSREYGFELDSGGELFAFSTAFWLNIYVHEHIDADPASDFHMFYFNTNATSLIRIDPNLLPPNVTAGVRQEWNRYFVHMRTSRLPAEGLGLADIHYLIAAFVE